MNNYFLLFNAILLLNCIIGIYAKNANYLVGIIRKETDKNYDDESLIIQSEIDEFVNDKMNEIYSIIKRYKDSYGEQDEKLKELNSFSLEKRFDKTKKLLFINEIRNSTAIPSKFSKRSGNFKIDYIPTKSELVSHICPIKNYYVINAYLSTKTKREVCPFPNLNKTLDTNYYYPSTAGKGIDIYLLDEDYNRYEGTEDERTITCDAVFSGQKPHVTNDEEKNKCRANKNIFPNHGIMTSSLAGGTLYGVAKKANIHMIAMDYSDGNILRSFDYILQHGKPHKTVISISFGDYGEYNKEVDNKLDELINKGYIIFTSAGNDGTYSCGSKSDKGFRLFQGYGKTIVIGAATQNTNGNGYMIISYSNYGNCVDLFAPCDGVCPNIEDGSTTDVRRAEGTSAATPITAGVAALIMAEHSEIEFNNELMRKTLIEMSIKNALVNYKINGFDTPNRFINNGKQKIYYPNEPNNLYCGGKSLNTCSDDECCTKDGECISFKDYPGDQCFIENGCQSEFGYCTTKEKSVEDCEKELNDNEECINSLFIEEFIGEYYYIKDDINNEDIPKYCKIINSQKCQMFYNNQFENQSICSIAKQYKKFEFIDNFRMEMIDIYKKICDFSFNVEEGGSHEYDCGNYINENFSNCILSDLFDIDNNNSNNDDELKQNSEFVQQCNNVKLERCQNFYKNRKEEILKNPSCSYLYENNDPSIIDLTTVYDEDRIDFTFNNYEKFSEKCKSVLDKNLVLENCNRELEEYKECFLDTNITKNSSIDKIAENCSSYYSEKCLFVYRDYEYYFPYCIYAQQFKKIDELDKLQEMDEIYNDLCIDNPSNELKEKIISDCEETLSPLQNQCLFEYYSGMEIEELSQKCEIFESEECSEVINSKSCNLAEKYSRDDENSFISKFITKIEKNNNICYVMNDDSIKQEYIDNCENTLTNIEFCNLTEKLTDEQDLKYKCINFLECKAIYDDPFGIIPDCEIATLFKDIEIFSISSENYKYYEEKCLPNTENNTHPISVHPTTTPMPMPTPIKNNSKCKVSKKGIKKVIHKKKQNLFIIITN
ncbi:subtilisin-like protein [Anaeromyces robustus]|uniref:Subtilisin-like protein n=1 Tax=Anaeromyces robustus TaxID=1754192 RepID=A0A1Y1WXY2_9FUNG|nr:subtilisin-like protein [Anaeromyces robustus]|eukprot:ORX78420.1 subtilisin-like protein [Anaeromyces robustus]